MSSLMFLRLLYIALDNNVIYHLSTRPGSEVAKYNYILPPLVHTGRVSKCENNQYHEPILYYNNSIIIITTRNLEHPPTPRPLLLLQHPKLLPLQLTIVF